MLQIERDNIRSLRDGARQALNMCRDAVTAKVPTRRRTCFAMHHQRPSS